ncbi:MAG TPA: ubiquinol-cytochrome c reductase iron-sulfur subunit [Gemmatimonadaceae bacterium]|nr:ubiquinol-cytochrome c reductase iron-sulfur subunit [Gemmatimonadaceae bacterium]
MTESRRAFIGRAGVVLGAVPLAGLAAGCASTMVHRVRPDAGQIRLDIAAIYDLQPEGKGWAMVQVEGDDAPLFVVRQNESTYVTLSAVCTHRGCTVEAKTDRFECPCHGSRYSRLGDVLKGPAERPLRRYRTALLTNRRTLVIDYVRDA